jgi:hypothetical protein
VVGARADRAQHVGLARDPDLGALVGRERVAAAGLGEAAKEDVLAAVEIEHLGREVRPAREAAHEVEEGVGREVAVARVDAERDGAGERRTVEKARQQREGQVVDRLEAEVLEHLDRRAAARAGGPVTRTSRWGLGGGRGLAGSDIMRSGHRRDIAGWRR